MQLRAVANLYACAAAIAVAAFFALGDVARAQSTTTTPVEPVAQYAPEGFKAGFSIGLYVLLGMAVLLAGLHIFRKIAGLV